MKRFILSLMLGLIVMLTVNVEVVATALDYEKSKIENVIDLSVDFQSIEFEVNQTDYFYHPIESKDFETNLTLDNKPREVLNEHFCFTDFNINRNLLSDKKNQLIFRSPHIAINGYLDSYRSPIQDSLLAKPRHLTNWQRKV